jgi:hypothetical protein
VVVIRTSSSRSSAVNVTGRFIREAMTHTHSGSAEGKLPRRPPNTNTKERHSTSAAAGNVCPVLARVVYEGPDSGHRQ